MRRVIVVCLYDLFCSSRLPSVSQHSAPGWLWRRVQKFARPPTNRISGSSGSDMGGRFRGRPRLGCATVRIGRNWSCGPCTPPTAPGRDEWLSTYRPWSTVWTPLGPAPLASDASGLGVQDYGPVAGRATAVAIDPADASGNTVYVGGAYGGVWKSTNAGTIRPGFRSQVSRLINPTPPAGRPT